MREADQGEEGGTRQIRAPRHHRPGNNKEIIIINYYLFLPRNVQLNNRFRDQEMDNNNITNIILKNLFEDVVEVKDDFFIEDLFLESVSLKYVYI